MAESGHNCADLPQDEQQTQAFLVLDSWAGRSYHPVEILGETPKKYRVRILSPDGVRLPRYRYAALGDVVLVPKTAITYR